MNRYRVICAYDGTDFQGWQSQPNGDGVQDVLEASLQSTLGVFTRIHGCSRTDSGVHARGQVFHFDANWRHPEFALQKAFSSKLPATIEIIELALVSGDFHARFSAIQKTYCYQIQRAPVSPFEHRWVWEQWRSLDYQKMTQGACYFVGTFDFSAFSASHRKIEKENTTKTVSNVQVVSLSENRLNIKIIGSGFLYKMVRTIVGVLVDVGLGRIEVDNIPIWLATGKRVPQIYTAPAKGLFLEKIDY